MRYCWLLLCLGFLFSWPLDSSALGDKYKQGVLKRAAIEVKAKTKYVWGPADCSAQMAKIFALVPKVRRSTAYRMSLGKDGWDSIEVARDKTMPTDAVFWNVRNYNPVMGVLKKNHPHTGLKTSASTIAHASGGRGYFLEDPWNSPWGRKIELYRRLTYGDAE